MILCAPFAYTQGAIGQVVHVDRKWHSDLLLPHQFCALDLCLDCCSHIKYLVHRHQARHSVESPMKIVDVSCTENRVYAFSSKIASLHPISSLLPNPEYLIHCSTYTYCLQYGSEWPLQRKAKYQLKFWGIKYNNEFVFFNFSLKLICYLSYECLKLLFLMHVYIYILFQIVIS